MTHASRSDKWHEFSVEEKLNALHEDIGKLFGIVEELSHKHHIFTDAFYVVNGKLDEHAKVIHSMRRNTAYFEAVN